MIPILRNGYTFAYDNTQGIGDFTTNSFSVGDGLLVGILFVDNQTVAISAEESAPEFGITTPGGYTWTRMGYAHNASRAFSAHTAIYLLDSPGGTITVSGDLGNNGINAVRFEVLEFSGAAPVAVQMANPTGAADTRQSGSSTTYAPTFTMNNAPDVASYLLATAAGDSFGSGWSGAPLNGYQEVLEGHSYLDGWGSGNYLGYVAFGKTGETSATQSPFTTEGAWDAAGLIVELLEDAGQTDVAPGVPTNVSATAGDTSASVVWTDETVGDPVPTYDVEISSPAELFDDFERASIGSDWDPMYQAVPLSITDGYVHITSTSSFGGLRHSSVDLGAVDRYIWARVQLLDTNTSVAVGFTNAAEDSVYIGEWGNFNNGRYYIWKNSGASWSPSTLDSSGGNGLDFTEREILFTVEEIGGGQLTFRLYVDDILEASYTDVAPLSGVTIPFFHTYTQNFGGQSNTDARLFELESNVGLARGLSWTSVEVDLPAGTETATETALTNGTEYKFRVRAENTVGPSSWVESNLVTPVSTSPTTQVVGGTFQVVNMGPLTIHSSVGAVEIG